MKINNKVSCKCNKMLHQGLRKCGNCRKLVPRQINVIVRQNDLKIRVSLDKKDLNRESNWSTVETHRQNILIQIV